MTAPDLQAIDGWYMRTIGEIPKSIEFLAEHDPDFLKAYRAKWEAHFAVRCPSS